MIFRIKADAEIDAKDFPDLCLRLGQYFVALGEGVYHPVLTGGNIEITCPEAEGWAQIHLAEQMIRNQYKSP